MKKGTTTKRKNLGVAGGGGNGSDRCVLLRGRGG